MLPSKTSLEDEIELFQDGMRCISIIRPECDVIGVTGPVCSGKSTLCQEMAATLADRLVHLPEVFTDLHQQGLLALPPKDIDDELFRLWRTRNQCQVMLVQMQK